MAANRPFTGVERRIWNRAINQEGMDLRAGDRHLGALLHLDGYIQNGGVSHGFDLPRSELLAGIEGFKFFGLYEMAQIIEPHRSEQEADLNGRYYRFTRGEDQIIKRFQQMLREHPERFAPLVGTTAG